MPINSPAESKTTTSLVHFIVSPFTNWEFFPLIRFSLHQKHRVPLATRNRAILISTQQGWISLPGVGYYFSSSARTKKTTASTNRQSMAIVMANRIQDDFSSNALTSYDHPTDEDLSAGTPVRARPAGRCRGLRTDSPIFRADLSLPRSHSQRRSTHSIHSCFLKRVTSNTDALSPLSIPLPQNSSSSPSFQKTCIVTPLAGYFPAPHYP